MPSVFHVIQVVDLPVTREQAWEWVADTDLLNRATGMPPVDVDLVGSTFGNTRTIVTEKHGLFALTWEEGPYEFVRPDYYRITRKVVRGPLLSIVSAVQLNDGPTGTRVTFELELTPRLPIFAPFVRRAARKQLHDRATRVAQLAADLLRAPTASPVWTMPAGELAPGAEAILAEKMPRVRRAAAAHADRFEKFLREAPDHELTRIRPFELADRWGASRMDVLKMLLHAAHADIVSLSWDVLCPHCRVPSFRSAKLGEITSDGACEACDLTYTTDFDSAVEVTFQVHSSVRRVIPTQFCLGSPAKRKGVLFQQVLGPKERREVAISLPAGDYVLMRADSENRVHLQVGDGGERYLAFIHGDGVTRGELSRPSARVRGPAVFALENGLDSPVRVGLAVSAISGDTATASIVTTFQDFRDLFSSQVLEPGVQLSRASVTLLFTDLKSSTALYQEYGDNQMYTRVRDHFAVLTAAVRAEGGGVVKTIGDAVMASFPTPAAGVRAAIAMQRAIARLNADKGTPELVVKLGLHAGPCLVVNANDRLDYFGNTVNQAARIEGQSKGGDLVVTEAIAADHEVVALLSSPELSVTRFETQLKGLSGSFALTRIDVSPAAKTAAAG